MALAITIIVIAVVSWTALVFSRLTGRFKVVPSDSLLEIVVFALSVLTLTLGLVAAIAGSGILWTVLGLAMVASSAGQWVISVPPASVRQLRLRVIGLKPPRSKTEIAGSHALLTECRQTLEGLGGELNGIGRWHVRWLGGEIERHLDALKAFGPEFQIAIARKHAEKEEFQEAGERYQEAKAYGPAALARVRAGDPEAAMAILREHKPQDYQKLFEEFRRCQRIDLFLELAELMNDTPRRLEGYREAGRLLDLARLYEATDEPRRAADAYREAEAWDDAIRLYEALNLIEPLADICMAQGHYEKAARQYEQMHALKKAAEAWQKAGKHDRAAELFRSEGRYEDAAQSFTQMMDYEKTAQMFTRLHDFAKAAEAYELGGDFRQAAEHYILAGDVEKAIATAEQGGVFDKLGEIYSNQEQFAKAGDAYARGKHFSSAASAYQKAGDPERAADCMANAGSTIKAAQYYESAQSWLKAAQLYEEAKNYEQATACFRKAGDVDGEVRCLLVTGAMEAAAAALVQAQRFAEAAELYQRAQKQVEAAETWISAGQVERAASMFAELGMHERSVELYLKQGKQEEAAAALVQLQRFDEAAQLYEAAGNFACAGDMYRRTGDVERAKQAFERCGDHLSAASMFFDLKNPREALYFLKRADAIPNYFNRLRDLPFEQVLDAFESLEYYDDAILYSLHFLSLRPAVATKFAARLHQQLNRAGETFSDLRRRHVDLILSFWGQNFALLRARLQRLTEELEIKAITVPVIEEKLEAIAEIFPYFTGLVAVEGPTEFYREKIRHYFEEYLDFCGLQPPRFDVLRHVLAEQVLAADYDGALESLGFVEMLPNRQPYVAAFRTLIDGMRRGDKVNAVYGFRDALNTVLAERPTGSIAEWEDVENLSRSVYHPETIMIRVHEDQHMHAETLVTEFQRRYQIAQDRIKIAERSARSRDLSIALEAVDDVKQHRGILSLSEADQQALYEASARLLALQKDPVALASLAAEFEAIFQTRLEVL